MREFCDKCKSAIKSGVCDCGLWFEPNEKPDYIVTFEKAITAYNSLNIDYPLSGDHHSGSCIVLFKGDYKLCEKVQEFIEAQSDSN